MGELGRGAGAQLEYDISEDHDGSLLVSLRGELDLTTAPALESRLEPSLAQRPERLIIDARGLEFADSSAIGLLVRWANRIAFVEIREPPDLLRHVIARMGLTQRLHVSP